MHIQSRTKIVCTAVRRASAGAIVLGALLLTAAPPASADDSYQLTSSNYSVSPWQHQTHTGYCATGYHVAGTWSHSILGSSSVRGWLGTIFRQGGLRSTSSALWNPDVTAHGEYISVWSTSGAQQNGSDSNGNPTYQAVTVTLDNASFISSHTGSFSWTCDPN